MKAAKKKEKKGAIEQRDIVIVHWWDAVSDTGWTDEAGIVELLTKDEQHLVYSVGVIIKKDKDYIYLVADWGFDENPYNRTLLIPRGMVKSEKVIKRWRR